MIWLRTEHCHYHWGFIVVRKLHAAIWVSAPGYSSVHLFLFLVTIGRRLIFFENLLIFESKSFV